MVRPSEIGSIEVGKLADLVLWRPAFFGSSKPELVIKGGLIAWAQMGDANASIPTPQPVFMRPMFGAFGPAIGADRRLASRQRSGPWRAKSSQHVWPEQTDCRVAVKTGAEIGIGKRDMKLNDALPKITVDPESYQVHADGQLLRCDPAPKLALAQRFSLF